MNSKRGQAALEFLMTYGWAILVVLVVIGALAYFGVLNPTILLPEKCLLETGLECKDWAISSTAPNIRLSIGNSKGKEINITMINMTSSDLTLPVSGCNNTVRSSVRVGSGARADIAFNCTGNTVGPTNAKVKANVRIQWWFTDSGPQYIHTTDGEIITTVRG